MKKLSRILSVLLVVLLITASATVAVSATADDVPYDGFADYGQQTFDVPASEGIKIDGVVSPGEYACTPIEVNKDSNGMTWLDWTKDGFPVEELPEILPYSIKYYVTYDRECLYIAAEIVEASLSTSCEKIDRTWAVDSLEVDIALDAYKEIPGGEYSQADMLDRVRTCYCLWDDGLGDYFPVGLCYTASSYGFYQVMDDMGDYMITRDEDKQLTTYEMSFRWEELDYESTGVPDQVFINFQLHVGDSRYLEYVQPGYESCLGGLRFAAQLTEQDMSDLDTDKSMALHIYNLTDAARLNGDVVEDTAAEETTEAPTDEVTEAPTEEITEAPTDAPATEAPTEAPTDAPATEAPTEAPKSGCGSALGMTAAALLVTAAAAVVLAKKD